ncbi:hypothetical protein L226DRAFT_610366 [Lentinus tigrinus ALCF2SS1-7]|uniref:uncharacterized protein n=1 Tax=Lentinus tigrinus ALCF2SS1-7 TaxID=1328758 RepID=UPI001166005F|nr:hypothetical protein L226DRAFT_610366 [Lentinus tigrinus ALCF2SS1-7]
MSGVQTAIALTAVQGFPPAIKDLITHLDSELESIQQRNALPSDTGRWATILTVRLQCNFDTFSTATPYVITRSRAMLFELYPGDTTLTSRFNNEVAVAQQRSADLNSLWLQFKMLYDGYLLHLEKADRETMMDVYPTLERSCEDVVQHAAAVVAGKARWDACFDLVLTEDGHQGYMETIDKRRAWATEAFPSEISRVTEEIRLLREERARLLQETSAQWDSQLTGWYTRAGDRVPVVEFCTALVWYLEVLKKLNAQSEKQKNVLWKFNALMRFAKLNTTTLNRAGEMPQAPIPVQDIRHSFEQFDQLWTKASRVIELCSPLAETLERHITTLKVTRERI